VIVVSKIENSLDCRDVEVKPDLPYDIMKKKYYEAI